MLTYIHKDSCHPPTIFKNLVNNISRRISTLSSNRDIFNTAAPYYNNALREGGHTDSIRFLEKTQPNTRKKKNRKRKILWYAPPFSLNAQTNVGKKFLDIIDKHFTPDSRYRKIFNRNSVKTSYSAMPNIKSKFKHLLKEFLNTY